MSEITNEILNKLDYDDVKNKKIFQKFLAVQQNSSISPERNHSNQDHQDDHQRAKSQELQQNHYRDMPCIVEESKSQAEISPERMNNSQRMQGHGKNDNKDINQKRIHSEEDVGRLREDNYGQGQKRQQQFQYNNEMDAQRFQNSQYQINNRNGNSNQSNEAYPPQQQNFRQQPIQYTDPSGQEDYDGELENNSKLVHGDYFSNSMENRRNQNYNPRDQPYQHLGNQNQQYSHQQAQYQQQNQRDGMWNEQNFQQHRSFNGNNNNNNNYYQNNSANSRNNNDREYDERRYDGNRQQPYESQMVMRDRGYGQGQGPRGLEGICADQEQQINRMAAYIHDFKEQSFRENSRTKAQMLELEATHQALKERLYELQRREDELMQENERMKQKVLHEQALRTNAEEDLRNANLHIEEIKDLLEEQKRECQRKESETISIRQQIEAMKQKHASALASSESTANLLRDEKEQLTREVDYQTGNGRQLAEIQQKNNGLLNENKRLYAELDEAQKASLELTHQAEQDKNELYAAKDRLIQKAQRETQLNAKIESQATEIETLKQLLHRAETSLLSNDRQDFYENRGNQQAQMYGNSQNSGGRSTGNLTRFRDDNKVNSGQINEDLRGNQQNQTYSPQRALKTQENMQETPEQFGMRKIPNNSNNSRNVAAFGQPTDASKISAENKQIYEKLRQKNANTPSNFLSWEVPDKSNALQKPQDKRNTLEQNETQQQGQQYYSQQRRDQKQQYTPEQSLPLVQQYQNQNSQQQQLQQPQQYPEQYSSQQIPNSRSTRNAEYLQYYNKQEFNSPQEKRGKETNQAESSEQVKGIENNLLLLNVERDKLSNELQKLEQVKLKSAQNIRRRTEIADEIALISNNISSLKIKLREANALY